MYVYKHFVSRDSLRVSALRLAYASLSLRLSHHLSLSSTSSLAVAANLTAFLFICCLCSAEVAKAIIIPDRIVHSHSHIHVYKYTHVSMHIYINIGCKLILSIACALLPCNPAHISANCEILHTLHTMNASIHSLLESERLSRRM